MVITCSGVSLLRVLYSRDSGGNRDDRAGGGVGFRGREFGGSVNSNETFLSGGKKLSTDQYTVLDVVVPEPSPESFPFSPLVGGGGTASFFNSPSNTNSSPHCWGPGYDIDGDGNFTFYGNVLQRVEIPPTPYECSKIEVLVLKRRQEHVCIFDIQAFARDLRSSALSTPISKTREKEKEKEKERSTRSDVNRLMSSRDAGKLAKIGTRI